MAYSRAGFLGLLLIAGTLGCTKPIQPTVVYPGIPFDIIAGRSVQIGDFFLTFDRLVSDSRCPSDAVCVSAGDAVIRLILQDAASRVERDLHTTPNDAATTTFSSYTIRLIDVTPYPRTNREVDPRDYSATLQITSR